MNQNAEILESFGLAQRILESISSHFGYVMKNNPTGCFSEKVEHNLLNGILARL
jgi:hypothetical protein